MKSQESLTRCATLPGRQTGSTRLKKLTSIFIFYNNATSTMLKHYPRRGYNIEEQIG